MDVDPDPQRANTSRGNTHDYGHHLTGPGLHTIAEEDPEVYGTPPGTPFDSDYPSHQTEGQTSADNTGGVRTENFFTPLYTESQDTDHTNINNTQPPVDIGPTDGTAEFAANSEEEREAIAAAEAEAAMEIAEATAREEAEAAALAEAAAAAAGTAATTVMETAVEGLTTEEITRAMAEQAARP